ncbi:hypothetical protein BDW74DRAFT_187670 [Aspergillus multicolor]|uniref:Zn(II)2Cys6 transcription factor n=1 Tax=Aspergillus multicolor TaxID=41759 RepID=UPI003CCD24EC
MTRRSCDRCYSIKVKCQPGRGRDASICRRCERLGHNCQTLRKIRPPGRRPQTTPTPSSLTPGNENEESREVSVTLHRTPSPCSSMSLRSEEGTTIQFLFSTTAFIPHFTIGPSFRNKMRQSLQTRFLISPENLLEGFLACAGEFALRSGHLPIQTQAQNMSRCATAIRKLRSLDTPTDIAQVRIMLALGTSILTYDQLASPAVSASPQGQGASMICRYVLSHAKPWYEPPGILALMPEMDFEMNCLIYLDTVECLLHRQIPVLRLRLREGEPVVDRYIGLCYSLLPLLYDVCMVGHEIKSQKHGWLEAWEKARDAIGEWQPSVSPEFAETYTSKEVIGMFTQANIHRQLGLLVLHRLRYPFREEDKAATVYSETILAESETCFQLSGDYPFKVGLALLIAGFELVEPSRRERLIRTHFGANCGLSAQPHHRVRHLLNIVWGERDNGENVSWFDVLAAQVPNFRYIP